MILKLSYLIAANSLWRDADEVLLRPPSGNGSWVRQQDRVVLSPWPAVVRSLFICPCSTTTSAWGKSSMQPSDLKRLSESIWGSRRALRISSFKDLGSVNSWSPSSTNMDSLYMYHTQLMWTGLKHSFSSAAHFMLKYAFKFLTEVLPTYFYFFC